MNLIFDFDGTICDSFDVGMEIVKTKFPQYFTREITPQQARDLGLKELIKKTKFPKHKLPQLMFSGHKEIAKEIPKLKTFPGMKSVIKELSKDHAIGIITSNSEENVQMFLRNNKLESYFLFVNSSFELFGKHKKLLKAIKKHQLDPKSTIYIGDETRDIEAAKKAGIKSVAVTWGYESEKVLKKANPDVIIRSPKELLDLVN